MVSILFTATDDVHSTFPALGARKAGFGDVPLICARELDVSWGTPLCLRVMVHLLHRAGPRRAPPRLPPRRGQPPRRPPGVGQCTAPRRAAVVGTGLIGGSIGLALRRAGWHVTGHDADERAAALALDMGAIDAIGTDRRRRGHLHRHARCGRWPRPPRRRWPRGPGIVTDVGSVKASVVEAVGDPRFLGGHPMAGSEQEGVEGADPDLFAGAVWVLTPTAATDDDTYALLRGDPHRPRAPTSWPSPPTTTTRWSRWCPTCPTSPPPR